MGSLVLASLFVTIETESSVTADVGSTVTLSAVTTNGNYGKDCSSCDDYQEAST